MRAEEFDQKFDDGGELWIAERLERGRTSA